MDSTKILVAYTTNAGTTAEVAQAVGEELAKDGRLSVEVKHLDEVESIDPYSAVVIGAPMIFGWHRGAKKFIKKHQDILSHLPVAYFITAMNLTKTDENSLNGIPLAVDPVVARQVKKAGRFTLKERYSLPSNYLRPILKTAPRIHPVAVGFFGGKLAMYRMKWWQVLFVLAFIQIQQGGSHNLPFIREWAAGLADRFATGALSKS
jgi:menaquinone-dependent protoporphyrinogen IX oxidase